VSTSLGCVGLAVRDGDELDRLITAVLPAAHSLGRAGALELFRWQDPSGARLIVAVVDDQWVELLPSFAGLPGALLANLEPVNDEVTTADVVDPDGEQLASVAVELEQRRLLNPADPPSGRQAGFSTPATLVALGTDVSVRDGAEAFEPFLAYTGFDAADEAEAYARLAGTIVRAERRTVVQTGQRFVAARVRTAGFQLDLCLSASEHPALPTPGQIVAGEVYLVASLEHLPADRPPTGSLRTMKKYGWRRD
jgi:hypothetical protein